MLLITFKNAIGKIQKHSCPDIYSHAFRRVFMQ